jgi:AcrR family transcriptional regulator
VARTKEKAAAKGELSSERVLEVAARLFREKGYLATSVREIGNAAEMKAGSLYYHYPSKESLLEAVVTQAITGLTQAVQSALEGSAGAPFRERLRVAIEAHLRSIHEHGDFAITSREAMDMLPEDSRKRHLALRTQYGNLWQALFEDAKAKGEVKNDLDIVPVQMLILGALNWTSEWLDPKRRSIQRASTIMTELVLDGMT